jgi:hypothetical protein
MINSSRLLCKSNITVYETKIMVLCYFSDDGHSALGNVHNFFDYCPDWKSAVLWEEWIQFGMKCFLNGEPCFIFTFIAFHGHRRNC